MKAIDRATVRDLGSLFIGGGFMLTANPCSDVGADALCQSVVDMAATVPHDGLIAVERMQERGSAVIDRPHVHWVMTLSKEKVEGIARELRTTGLNVEVTPVWSADGLCYYLGKDPGGKFYVVKEEDFTSTGTPPAAIQGQKASGPAQEDPKDTPIEEKRQDAFWGFLKGNVTRLLSYVSSFIPSARPVMVGMTRAP